MENPAHAFHDEGSLAQSTLTLRSFRPSLPRGWACFCTECPTELKLCHQRIASLCEAGINP